MVPGARQAIEAQVLTWADIESQPHRFGGREYTLGKREIGHIHGDELVDIPFPKKVRDELVAAGQARAHHILPESGWISLYLNQPEDVGRAVKLLLRSYELAKKQKSSRANQEGDNDAGL